jgi:hypothetical protein
MLNSTRGCCFFDARKNVLRMPQIFRPMKRDAEDLPEVGTRSKELGVRVPPDKNADIDLDSAGRVELNRRGMSVTADWHQLMPHLIPKRLKQLVYGAAGPDELAIFRFGEGVFEDATINEELELALKQGSVQNGNVTPKSLVHIDVFLANLAATKDQWIIDEH